jgi:hypothetical protein
MFSIFKNIKSKQKKHTIGFEDIKIAITKKHIIINTLPIADQQCLIQSTIQANKEEQIINEFIVKTEEEPVMIIYGRNATDQTPNHKYDQLKKLGFDQVYIYSGGLFEWLLLQNIYGETEFPTTTTCKDLLQYRPLPLL